MQLQAAYHHLFQEYDAHIKASLEGDKRSQVRDRGHQGTLGGSHPIPWRPQSGPLSPISLPGGPCGGTLALSQPLGDTWNVPVAPWVIEVSSGDFPSDNATSRVTQVTPPVMPPKVSPSPCRWPRSSSGQLRLH